MLKETIDNNEEFSTKQLEEAYAKQDQFKSQYDKEVHNMLSKHQEEVLSLKKKLDNIKQKLNKQNIEHEKVLNELKHTNIIKYKKNQKYINSLQTNIIDLNKQITSYVADKVTEVNTWKALIKEMKLLFHQTASKLVCS